VPEWRTVPVETKYWHPVNRGFNSRNAKLMCSQCGAQQPLPPCPDCGEANSQLGTTMGLPGVFCEECERGSAVWKCPECQTSHKIMLVFCYDILAIKVRKRKFWE